MHRLTPAAAVLSVGLCLTSVSKAGGRAEDVPAPTAQAAADQSDAHDVATKVDNLLSQMTLDEKIGQLTLISAFWDVTGPAPKDDEGAKKFAQIESGIVGGMLNVVGADEVQKIQTYAVENSRLGIPMLFGYDVIHGQKTIFPIPLAEAASWDLGLIELSAQVAAREAAAQGVNWTFAPMADISRDPRWGRVMEGAGEDPYLGAKIAVARVRGFQGDDLSRDDTIAATVKHFAGYGFTESGRDYDTVDVGTVTLFNTVLPPFKAAVQEGGVRSVMNAFNVLNSVPATGDRYLQRDILKGAWGFDGFVVSDWGSMIEMMDHGVVADERDAAQLALSAGSDMDMESHVFSAHLSDLVVDGQVDIAEINDAVRRILTVKYELGLFDDPFRYGKKELEEGRLLSDDHRAAARQVAEKSIVLLKNEDGLLPLTPGESVALIGALAADKDTPLGNWRGQGETGTAISVVEGFQAAGLDFAFAEGAALEMGAANFATEVEVNMTDRSGFDAAVSAARAADKVVMVLGEDALQSGEGRSRAELGFPGVQQDLLEAVHAANPNVILVVMSGRPLVLTWAEGNVPSIVQAWHLGHESGHAITRVLTGEMNPSGKLPMTFPRSVGQVPVYYNRLNTGRPGPREEVFWAHYIDEENAPLYPFGHGLSYTDFDYDSLRVRRKNSGVEVSVRVANTGDVAGEEVVQLYIRDRVASISRPLRELKGFQKIALEPGQKERVTFTLTGSELGFYDGRGEFRVEAGEFDVFVGGSSAATLTKSFAYSDK